MRLRGSFVDQICQFESFVIGKSRSRVGRSAISREWCRMAVVGGRVGGAQDRGSCRYTTFLPNLVPRGCLPPSLGADGFNLDVECHFHFKTISLTDRDSEVCAVKRADGVGAAQVFLRGR